MNHSAERLHSTIRVRGYEYELWLNASEYCSCLATLVARCISGLFVLWLPLIAPALQVRCVQPKFVRGWCPLCSCLSFVFLRLTVCATFLFYVYICTRLVTGVTNLRLQRLTTGDAEFDR